jgi:hypothetical protein
MRVAATLGVVIGSLGFVASARAQPVAKAAGKVPMLAVPCVPSGDLALLASDGQPVVCWASGCMAPDLTSLAATMVAQPAPTPAWLGTPAEVRTAGGGLAACKDTTCKPLGAKLTAAVAAARAADSPSPISVTTDLKAVAIGGAAWSVAKDKPLAFKAPRSYRGQVDRPTLASVVAAGNLMVTTWYSCAGPCGVAQVTDSGGKNLGAEVSGGGPIVQLDADQFAVTSEYGDLHVFTVKGKHVDDLTGGGDPSSALVLVRLGEGELAILRGDPSGGTRIEQVSTSSPGPRISAARTLPFCAP